MAKYIPFNVSVPFGLFLHSPAMSSTRYSGSAFVPIGELYNQKRVMCRVGGEWKHVSEMAIIKNSPKQILELSIFDGFSSGDDSLG